MRTYGMTDDDAREFVDQNGGVTLGGLALADAYFKKYANSETPIMELGQYADDIRHNVVCAGYNEDGIFDIILSTSYLNG